MFPGEIFCDSELRGEFVKVQDEKFFSAFGIFENDADIFGLPADVSDLPGNYRREKFSLRKLREKNFQPERKNKIAGEYRRSFSHDKISRRHSKIVGQVKI